jgi:hypothetical protein
MAKRSVKELSVCGLGLFGGVVLHFSTGRKCPKWKNKEGLGRSSATNPLPFPVRWRQWKLPRTTHPNQPAPQGTTVLSRSRLQI